MTARKQVLRSAPARWRSRRGAAAVITVAATLVLAACGSSGGSGNATGSKSVGPTKVKISTNGAYIAYAPLFIAQQQGYFKDQNLSVDITINSDTQAAAAALVNNDVQFSLLSGTHAWQADLSGRPTTIVAANDGQLMQTLVITKAAYTKAGLTGSSSLTDRIKAMRGLNFGARSLTSQDGATLVDLLKYAGLSQSDAKFTTLTSPPALVSAMKAHSIDGFVSGAPFPQQVVSQGLAVTLIDLQAGEFPPFAGLPADVYTTNQTFLKSNPEQVQQFVNAIAMADRYINLHPQQAAELLHSTKDFQALPMDLLSSQLASMAQHNGIPPNPTLSVDALRKGLPLLAAAIGKQPSLNIASTFTNEFAAKSVAVAKSAIN